AIARWRGAWAALAFFGLSYTYLRSFAPTTLTEPIGIAWGLLAVTFLVRSLATGSRTAAVAGIGALVCSLMTRMGAMFAVPALIAWLVLRRGEPRRVRTAVVVTVVVIAIFSMSQVLS